MGSKKSTAIIGHGTTIEFLSFGFIGQATNFRAGRGAVESIEITNFDSPAPSNDDEWGGIERIPAPIGEPGQISLTIVWSPESTLPQLGKKDTIRIVTPTMPGYSVGTVWSGEGYIESVEMTAEVKGAYTADCVIQRSGVWTETPAVRTTA